MATGAESEPHGRAKVIYDCESETWLENSSHKQWPSESTKTKRNCATGQKGQKNNTSSSQIQTTADFSGVHPASSDIHTPNQWITNKYRNNQFHFFPSRMNLNIGFTSYPVWMTGLWTDIEDSNVQFLNCNVH